MKIEALLGKKQPMNAWQRQGVKEGNQLRQQQSILQSPVGDDRKQLNQLNLFGAEQVEQTCDKQKS